MKKSLENKIRLNIIFLYCIIAFVCSGILFYIYTLSDSINIQKNKIKENNTILSYTNNLVYSVQHAQALTNLYISTQEKSYISDYQDIYMEIELVIDTLLSLSDHSQYEKIMEIGTLLNENETIILKLDRQFIENNPFDTIRQTILNQKLLKSSDSLLLDAFRYDTTINNKSKKNFWSRLVDLFAPAKSKDTILTISTIRYDTIKFPKNYISKDISNILVNIQAASQQANNKYLAQLTEIRRYVNNLIFSERQISEQISKLLLDLHQETINSTLCEIEKSEQIIKRNYNFLLICGIISLLLILVFILLIVHDVNKGRAARKALEEANELTKRLMEERHKLLLSVSHDIKAPLTSIFGYIDLWKQDPNLSKELSGLSSMENSGKYILSLLENLLEFSKLEQGTMEINQTDFHLETLYNEIKEMFIPLIEKKQLEFDTEFCLKSTLWLYSDRLKIKQIIINILSNAVKYTQKGKIIFSTDYTNNKLYFVINDTGAGISEKEQDKLFKPFSRIEKNNSLASGSGFGLYVVKGLVDLLQGEIVIRSKEGKGTNVEISIPVKEIKQKNATLDEDIPEKFCLPCKKCKLLVIDDDNSLLLMLQEMTLRLGHEITVCNSLVEFEKHIFDISNYDIILTDMEMGSFSGLDILQNIKEMNIQIPVIVMTARSDFDSIKALNQGFDGYLSKPFTLKSLQKLLGDKPDEINKNSSANTTEHFKLLSEMFDGDKETIESILNIFVDTTVDNLLLLQQCINKSDFPAAQSICHKMLPMFAQLETTETVAILKKMDSMCGRNSDKYPDWKNDLGELIRLSHSLIDFIRKEYFTD